jgi:glycosyltransferase involved in cell wall biosynthesis
VRLTIITPTKNAEQFVTQLINALNKQTNKNFEWLVVDGGSDDQTKSIIHKTAQFQYKIIDAKDFSIYHATNIAVENVETEYYAVSGADDHFFPNFVESFYAHVNKSNFDILFGATVSGSEKVFPGRKLGWLNGMHGIGSSHSIGSIIKTDLHYTYGMYSKMYPVVADQFFIKNCVYGGAKVTRTDEVFGHYSLTGFSSTNALHYQLDFFKMQLHTERYKVFQFLIFTARLIKLFLKR